MYVLLRPVNERSLIRRSLAMCVTYLRLPQYLGELTELKQEFREKSDLFNKRYNEFFKNDVYFTAFVLDPPFLCLFS